MNLQIHLKRLECNIIKYILTLTFNQSKNQISGIEEIESSSNNGHLIENLYPGYNYSIYLTPKTNKGPMMSSHIYSFTPLITSNILNFINLFKHAYRTVFKFKPTPHFFF
jgi:hypothetical protein